MSARLLWVDDEIDLLKAHCIFLQKRGYEVATASNGRDAIELCRNENFDLVLLDENMPGLSGLETLAASLGEEAVTIEDVCEPYLMQLGFLARTARGRVVTPAAYEHLGLPPQGQDNPQQQLF